MHNAMAIPPVKKAATQPETVAKPAPPQLPTIFKT